MTALSERDVRILAFERSWWRQAGAKERDILEAFELMVCSVLFHFQCVLSLDD